MDIDQLALMIQNQLDNLQLLTEKSSNPKRDNSPMITIRKKSKSPVSMKEKGQIVTGKKQTAKSSNNEQGPKQQNVKKLCQDDIPRWKLLYDRGVQQQQLIEQQRILIQNCQNEADENLTFKPNLSLSKNYRDYQGQSDLSFIQRNQFWQKRKSQKIHQIKQEMQYDEMNQCSFRPQVIKSYKNDKSPTKVSKSQKKGWIEYFDRIQQAKKKEEQKTQNTKIYGQNWKNTLTRPVEPKMILRSRSKSPQNKINQRNADDNKENDGSSSPNTTNHSFIFRKIEPEIKALRESLYSIKL